MSLISTCLARLGSRFSLIFDPVRQEIHYGALGLMHQSVGEMIVSIDDLNGNVASLPFTHAGEPFYIVDQQQTMTSLVFEAYSPAHGVKLRTEIIAPFWPQNEMISIVPAYILNFTITRLNRVRWTATSKNARRDGVLKFGLKLPNASCLSEEDLVRLNYPVSITNNHVTGEGGGVLEFTEAGRKNPLTGNSSDLIMPLIGNWKTFDGVFEIPFDLKGKIAEQNFSLGLCCYCDAPLFERFGNAMRLKYTATWKNVDEVAKFLKLHLKELITKSQTFDSIWVNSSLPLNAQNLSALSFQSYLMNTMWCTNGQKEWFSVWEGSCGYNSTVDVTYNEALFYFSCWPELLEMIFEEWGEHIKTAQELRNPSGADRDFPGAILEHDMGFGWTANGQSYHHQMPVEENSNFLLLLYAYGKWCGKEQVFTKHDQSVKLLAEYLLWADTTGNGFPDKGTSNTIDDANPAVQYGRDNVYLGIKRLAALHAAGRMFEYLGERSLVDECENHVRKAVITLNAGWLGDHWGVCLDKSAQGLVDCWSGERLPYDTLPGWDAYSLYTTNGLLYLMMVDDMPPGLDNEQLRIDLINAIQKSLTKYGCGHSSLDKNNVWVSMNVWRDCAGGYLGENLLSNCERYWNMQVFANSLGSEKPNCFSETYLNNNLVWYPRNAAIFGLLFAVLRLKVNGLRSTARLCPLDMGHWPILPLADWKNMKVPFIKVGKKPLNSILDISNNCWMNEDPFFVLECND